MIEVASWTDIPRSNPMASTTSWVKFIKSLLMILVVLNV